MTPLFSLLLAAACSTGTVKIDDTGPAGDGGSTDGGSETDGGSSDGGSSDGGSGDGGSSDGGSSDGGSSDGGSEELTTLHFDLEPSTWGGVLSLVQVTELGGETIGLGDVFAGAVLSGSDSLELEVGPAPSEHLLEIDPVAYPGFHLAMYAPVPTLDESGDLAWQEGESVVGGTLHWPAWLEAPVPEDLQAQGFAEGWNVLVLDFEDEPPVAGDIDGIPVSFLADQRSLTVGGTWSVEVLPVDYAGVVVLPAIAFDGTVPSEVMDQGPASESWTLQLDGEPPLDHWTDVDEDGSEEAIEVFGAFPDLDHDGTWDADREIVSVLACHDRDFVLASWGPVPTTVQDGLFYTLQGYPAGWVLLADPDGEGRLLEPGEELELSFDEGCSG